MIFPIVVDRNSKVLDWPMMILASVLFYAFAFDGTISMLEGGILFSMLVAFTIYLIRSSRKSSIGISSRSVGTIDGRGKVINQELMEFDVINLTEEEENEL